MVEDVNNTQVGRAVRALRAGHGASQEQLAEDMRERGHAKWSQATVWSVEQGTRPLRLTEAVALADALDVEVADLHRDETETAPLAQIEGVIRMVADQYTATREADRALEYLRRQLAGMVDLAEFPLPRRIQEYADEWSREDLAEDAIAWARRDLEGGR